MQCQRRWRQQSVASPIWDMSRLSMKILGATNYDAAMQHQLEHATAVKDDGTSVISRRSCSQLTQPAPHSTCSTGVHTRFRPSALAR